jgi:hypothetical protein
MTMLSDNYNLISNMTHALTPSFLPVIVIASLTCVSHGKMFIADNKEGIISKK